MNNAKSMAWNDVKKNLELPFEWKDMRTTRSTEFFPLFTKYTVNTVIDNQKLLEKFSLLSTGEKLAALCDAYNWSLDNKELDQAADLAGGIFYFLTTDEKLSENLKSAETFYENVLIYGYSSMWCKLAEAAQEANVRMNNPLGVNIIDKVRKRGLKELGVNFERLFIVQHDLQNELYKKDFCNKVLGFLDNPIVTPVLAAAIIASAYLIAKYGVHILK